MLRSEALAVGPFPQTTRDRRKADPMAGSEARFRALVQNSFDIITIHNAEGVTMFESPAASRILGYPPGALIGKSPFDTIHPKDVARAKEAFLALVRGVNNQAPVFMRFRHADGSWIHLEALGNNLLNHPGIRGIVLTSRDVSERKRAEKQVQFLANYDVLTELPNRFLMLDRLTQAVAHAHRADSRLAMMHVGLNRFKVVNETLGHLVGDSLLKQTADRIRKATREGDTAARVGGDEFSVIFPNVTNLQDISAAAEAIIEDLSKPYAVAEQQLFLSASIGISLFPDDADSVDEVIKHADAALSSAKHQGRGNYQFFTANLNHEVHERMQIEAGLRTAIERNELNLQYQPKIDLKTRKIFGAEALLRWNHPKLGEISPKRFIPVAEDAGLVGEIGEWVLRQACRQIREWQEDGHSLQVAVNVSARQFQQYDVAEMVQKILEQTGVHARNLEIELTESAVMDNPEASIVALERLAALGVEIAVDDFGTGYSSLSYLKRLPLDLLKIDQSFVRDISSDPNDAAIVRAIINLASSLGIKVIAEGVETDAQLAFLNAYGCQYAQGYLFGEPLAPEQLIQLMQSPQLCTA
ncbi:MAG: putative bifunctional diguanylate cyclase/phosphodiesterase [Burkholderiales bacterium]